MTAATEEAPAAPTAPAAAPKLLSSDQGFWTIAWRQFRKDRIAVMGLIVCALLAALAIFSPFLANGKPYQITGVLTNFYSNDVAAFRDWHGRYLEVADDLLNAKALSPAEKVEKEGLAALYAHGLPRILDRMGTYMRPDDRAALDEVTRRYEKLLAVPAAQLDRPAYEALGGEIEDRFGAFAYEPAYMRVAQPLTAFSYPGDDGSPAPLKRITDAQDDLRTAKEDDDKAAIAEAEKKLAALAPEADATAAKVEASGKNMASFLEDADAKALVAATTELAGVLRAIAKPGADPSLAGRMGDLATTVDGFASRHIAPERQRIPRTTLHPVVDYLGPREVGFIVLYVWVFIVIILRRPFLRLTELLPFDPSDLGLVRFGAILAPAFIAAFVWYLAVPEREPPSDTYYKSFAENLAKNPDPQSSISFAPVPYGENENLQFDKVSAPTWCEDTGHIVKRLRAPDHPLPPGVTEEQLGKWMDGTAKERADNPQNAVIAPWAKDLIAKRLTSTRYHWLGTDYGGRDVCARIIMGSRVSLSVGFVSVGLNVLIGVLLGALAGYFGGWVDIIISRFTEVIICIPFFFLILTVIVIMPAWIPAIWAIMLTIGLIGWTSEMRLIRGEFLRLVGLDFVVAGRALGLSNTRIIFRHMLPNAMAPVLVAATFGVAGAILTESGLSFLGFGIQPPAASWGSVLNEAFEKEKDMWWVTIFPGFMIFITITAYNLVGEGFRDATDPRLRK